MEFYESSATIAAARATVWSVLTDADGYREWDNGVIRIEGTIAAGEKIKIHSEVDPKRAFGAKVTEFDAPGAMTWSGGMPLGLFKGIRTFRLTENADGGTDFSVREEFSGPMLGLIWKSMPDLTDSFEQFAQGLKAEAESRAG
ncbi:MAG: SRPBCC domain-containing protein [Actinomycetota bacterium]